MMTEPLGRVQRPQGCRRVGAWLVLALLAASAGQVARAQPGPLYRWSPPSPPSPTAKSPPPAPLPPPAPTGKVSEGMIILPSASKPAPAPLPGITLQEPGSTEETASASKPVTDPAVTPAACSSCNSGLLGPLLPDPTATMEQGPTGCGLGQCVPGRKRVGFGGDGGSWFERLVGEAYQCVCCPEPCYEARWLPLVDSAFFIDCARPVTQMRFRNDYAWNFEKPDRAEYFWARQRTNPNQVTPEGLATGTFGKGPEGIAEYLNYCALKLYIEGAANPRTSVFVEIPYMHIDPHTATNVSFTQEVIPGQNTEPQVAQLSDAERNALVNRPLPPNTPLPFDVVVGENGARVTPVPGSVGTTGTDTVTYGKNTVLSKGTSFPGTLTIIGGDSPATDPKKLATPTLETRRKAIASRPVSGFTDMNVGFKGVLLDCELLLMTFQFKTYIPIGDFTKGLGNGHVSLEPSILWALKLTPETYLQGQCAYWIPIGGDQLYQGNVFHWSVGVNQELWRPCPGLLFTSTLEFHNWWVINGRYTDTDTRLPNPAAGGDAGADLAPVASPAHAFMFSVGPGIRMFVCDKIDMGIGTLFSLTGDHFEGQMLRADLRWRF